VGVSPKKVATVAPPEIQVVRSSASVSQNQSADSAVRSRKRVSLCCTWVSRRIVRRAPRYITR